MDKNIIKQVTEQIKAQIAEQMEEKMSEQMEEKIDEIRCNLFDSCRECGIKLEAVQCKCGMEMYFPDELCDDCFDVENALIQKILFIFKYYKDLPDGLRITVEINNRDIIITEGIIE